MVKISKVQHIRAAQIDGKGLLYIPASGKYQNEDTELTPYVKRRKDSAAGLYKILNEKSKGNLTKIKELNKSFSEVVSKARKEGAIPEKKQDIITSLKDLSIEIKDTKGLNTVIDESLRTSLRGKYRTYDGETEITGLEQMKKLVEYLVNKEQNKAYIDSPELAAFVELLIGDTQYQKTHSYDKKKKERNEEELGRLAPVPTSIAGQNIKVKLKGDALTLSSKKKELIPFLQEYACADKDKKRALLEFQRYCLALLVFGKDFVQENWKEFGGGKDDLKAELFGHELDDKVISIAAEKNYSEIIDLEKNKEKKENRLKIRLLREKNDAMVRDQLYENFRAAKELFKGAKEAKEATAWLEHFLDLVLPLAVKNPYMTKKNLKCMHLCHMAWSHHIAYLREKYTDLGKAVYHFAIPKENPFTGENKEIEIGAYIKENAPFGLSSFGYEYIKAEESLQKELSLYIQFAANNFSRAVFPVKTLQKNSRQDALFEITGPNFPGARIDLSDSLLRYFGGASSLGKKPDGGGLAFAIRECIYPLRNQSFHYTGKISWENEKESVGPVRELFKTELENIKDFYMKQFNSNSVWMFYSKENSVKLLKEIHEKASDTPAQIPSFKKVFPRSSMTAFLRGWLPISSRNALSKSAERTGKFRSCLYFLFEKIYYNVFLADTELPKLFLKEVKNLKGKKNKWEVAEFQKTVTEKLKDKTIEAFGRMCQYFVSEYDRQNHEATKEEDLVYKNYPLLMHKCLKEAFIEYIENKYAFLRNEVSEEDGNELEESDIREVPVNLDIDSKDSLSIAWYATARFLVPEYINKLIGEFNKYNQFVEDIMERYCFVSGVSEAPKQWNELEKKIKENRKVIRVLHFALEKGSQCSGNLSDYFSAEQYEKILEQYIDEKYSIQEKEKDSTSVYYDGKNYILNRNLVFASMFGAEGVLPGCMTKITAEEIEKYTNEKKECQGIFMKQAMDPDSGRDENKGILTEEQQRKLREFQELKNRVELTDVLTLSKMINDLMVQLIVWAYLRERDKMYFQLGYHYMQLTSVLPKDADKITSSDGHKVTKGAMIYEIAAAYDYAMPMFKKDNGKIILSEENHNPEKGRKIFEPIYPGCYDEGLELFSADEKRIRKFRNRIDHFHYFYDRNNIQQEEKQSLLNLYAEAYDSFLKFSTNYRKSVPLVLSQILEEYKVKAAFKIDYTGGKMCFVRKYESFRSGQLTFTVQYEEKKKQGEKTVTGKKQFDAQSDVFLQQVASILEYKH